MEILKDNPIIDHNYKPSLEMGYIDYFNRAVVFAQTNYQEQLSKLANTHFRKITPTIFFEEYAWCVCTVGLKAQNVSKYFPTLISNFTELYRIFWDLNNFPNKDFVMEKLLPIVHHEQKCEALWSGARIINNGIKLFTWNKYRDHFLNSPIKLQAFPFIGTSNSENLARNIGLSNSVIGNSHLNRMAARWGFESAEVMCKTISNHIVLQPKVIGLILWYAASTFGTNISRSLI